MTETRRSLSITALLLAIFILLATMVNTRMVSLPTLPNQPHALNAAIKTQNAADRILQSGGVMGIDVSKYQGRINWRQVAASGVSFAFIRASYGTTSDPYFITNVSEANANGIKVGAYHFATFKTTAEMKKEASFFLSHLKQVDISYPVVLDLEGESQKKLKKSTLTKLATDFMDIVKAEGYDVMLYSYNNFIKGHLDERALSGYGLWVANYLEQPNTIDHKVWQHTASGAVSGIKGPVDINIAYNDLTSGRRTSSGSVKVNKTISNSIKQTLNDRYASGLPIEGLNMTKMNDSISRALQTEVNRQWGLDLAVDGQMTREQVNTIASVTFTPSTQGNITYLIQAKLFYKGYYTGELTAVYDSATANAVEAFQKTTSLEVDGRLDAPTLHKLLL